MPESHMAIDASSEEIWGTHHEDTLAGSRYFARDEGRKPPQFIK
jgi:hypothetical protein